MKPSVWGPITWNLLHTIAEKIYPDKFNQIKPDLPNIINYICSSIPCPVCRKHAAIYIKSNSIHSLQTRDELILYLFNFHNVANTNSKKSMCNTDVLNQYKNFAISNTLNIYINLYSKNKSDDLTYGFRKNLHVKQLHKLLVKHTTCFSA